jgi:hypothetical protein
VPPQIVDLRQASGNILFSFNSVAGQNYITEFKSAIATNLAWTALQTNAGDGTRITVTNSWLAGTNRFLRVKTE